MKDLVEHHLATYQPSAAGGFRPERVVLTRGALDTPPRQAFVERLLALFPDAERVEALGRTHMQLGGLLPQGDAARRAAGRRTLVVGTIATPLRRSRERDIVCPNYLHFSPTAYCSYGCAYCYLAGSCSTVVAPVTKVFVNLEDALAAIARKARRLAEPTSFYVGKLQDAIALDPLTGFSRVLVPFFAAQPLARLVMLTKSDCVENLLAHKPPLREGEATPLVIPSESEEPFKGPGRDHGTRRIEGAGAPERCFDKLSMTEGGKKKTPGVFFSDVKHWTSVRCDCEKDSWSLFPVHRGHTVVSWSVNPEAVCRQFEGGAPPLARRLDAARRCQEAGYPIRFLIMPSLPVDDWRRQYAELVESIFASARPERITLGGICSYGTALRLTAKTLGAGNLIARHISITPSPDGRRRFPRELRADFYRHIIGEIRRHAHDLPVGLCLEEAELWHACGLDPARPVCNCVW